MKTPKRAFLKMLEVFGKSYYRRDRARLEGVSSNSFPATLTGKNLPYGKTPSGQAPIEKLSPSESPFGLAGLPAEQGMEKFPRLVDAILADMERHREQEKATMRKMIREAREALGMRS